MGGKKECGLYAAAVGSENWLMNEWVWTRDAFYNYLAADDNSKNEMMGVFKGIVDYNKGLGKFDSVPKEDWQFIHPLYKGDLTEIRDREHPFRGWAFVQTDSYGNLLEMMSLAEDKGRADLMLGYLNMVNYSECKDHGFWEYGTPEVHASSLAACLRGIERYEKSFGKTSVTRDLKDKGYGVLVDVLKVGETYSKGRDSALMSLIYPGGLDEKIIGRGVKRKIVKSVLGLEGEHGFKRFEMDSWDGIMHHDGRDGRDLIVEGQEMQWLMFNSWAYKITGDMKYLRKAKLSRRKFGNAEGVVPVDRNDLSKGWMMNCTGHLYWTESMNKIVGI